MNTPCRCAEYIIEQFIAQAMSPDGGSRHRPNQDRAQALEAHAARRGGTELERMPQSVESTIRFSPIELPAKFRVYWAVSVHALFEGLRKARGRGSRYPENGRCKTN